MTDTITTRQRYPDSVEVGSPTKGGALKIYFDASDLKESEQRADNAVAVRQYLLNKLTQGGMKI